MAGAQKPEIGILAVLRDLGPDARFFVFAIGLTRLTSFMVFPFLTVILNQRLGASIPQIGALFTVGALAGLAAAPVSGFIADGMRQKTLMTGTVALMIACFLALAAFPNLVVYFVVITLFSVAGGVLEPLLRSALGDFAETDADRPALFHVRYYIVNVAGAVGPFLGLWFVANDSDAVFGLAALSYVLLAWAIHFRLRERAGQSTAATRGTGLRVIREVLRHRLFVGLFLSNFLLVFVYMQTDEPLTFHMLDTGVPDVAAIIAILSFTNTAVVLLLHGVFMKRIMALGEQTGFMIAIVCLALSLILIALNGGHFVWVWVAAIAVSTIGEIVALPMFLTIVDRVAPKDQRNSFFGVYVLSNTGGALAPLLAAQVIEAYGGTVLFAAAALCCLPLAAVGYVSLRQHGAGPEEGGKHEPV